VDARLEFHYHSSLMRGRRLALEAAAQETDAFGVYLK
jgi:hypothetical protein